MCGGVASVFPVSLPIMPGTIGQQASWSLSEQKNPRRATSGMYLDRKTVPMIV